MTYIIKELPNCSVKLTVTVPFNEVKNEYDRVLNKISKNLSVPGFRKGKVPEDLIKKKYEKSLKAETMQNLIKDNVVSSIESLDDSKKPISVSQPRVADPENELDLYIDEKKDFIFSVIYDIKPILNEINSYKNIDLEIQLIKVSENDLESELKKYQEKYADIKDSEDPLKENHIITLDYVELDGEDEIKSTLNNDVVLTIGKKNNYYQLDDDLIGLTKGTHLITKEYSNDFINESLQGQKKHLKIEIKRIREKILPVLDDEFAQDIDEKYSNIDDFKNDIKVKLNEKIESINNSLKEESLMQNILANNDFEIPESMMNYQKRQYWANFVRSFGGKEEFAINLLKEQGLSIENLIETWLPNIKNSIKSDLIIRKLNELENIKISDEQVDKEISEYIQKSKNQEDAKKYYENEEVKEHIKNALEDNKLMQNLLNTCNIKVTSELSYSEYESKINS